MRSAYRVGCLLLVHSAACSKRPPPAERVAPVAAQATTSRPSTSPSQEPSAATQSRAEALPALDESAVKATIRAWSDAQRAHRPAAYAEFYSPHFTGLLRSGAGFSHVDRHAWLAAEQATLLPRTARAPRIALGAGGAHVIFESHELFLVPSSNGPQIAWQAPLRPTVSALSPRLGLWLADENSALLSATPDPTWADGPPAVAGTNRASRSVAMTRLPKALRAWLGRRVQVLGAHGLVCETRLQRFSLRAEIAPDLRTREHWEGCADEPPVPPATIAEEIWRLTGAGGRHLIAEFSTPCKGALLAIDPDLPVPAIAAPEPASAELGARAMVAFRQLPEYSRIQARFRAAHPDVEGAWDDRDARRQISSLALPGHAPLVFISVEAGAGCADFSASLSALWHGGGEGTALSAIDDQRLTPSAIVDFDGNGGAILLGPDGLFQTRSLIRAEVTAKAGVPAAPSYARIFLSSVPFFAGPC